MYVLLFVFFIVIIKVINICKTVLLHGIIKIVKSGQSRIPDFQVYLSNFFRLFHHKLCFARKRRKLTSFVSAFPAAANANQGHSDRFESKSN